MSILVVGALHLDVIVRAPYIPKIDETVSGRSVEYVIGGKGANQALAIARLGGAVRLAGRAGSDAFGDMIREAVRKRGVDASLLQTDPGPSGMSVAVVDANGEYGAVIVSEANLRIETETIVLPADTSLVLLQNEVPEDVNISVAVAAKALGANVWLNAAPARDVSEALLSQVDLLIVNRVEAEFYDQLQCNAVVITTLGADGVSFAGKRWPAPKVKVLSTHGAGDVFVGALALQTARGESTENAIAFAQAAAGWHVSTDALARDSLQAEDLVSTLKRQFNL
ncbi:MAG: PfkB family carbohydrate kinase [Pseudomonadota bacterium]